MITSYSGPRTWHDYRCIELLPVMELRSTIEINNSNRFFTLDYAYKRNRVMQYILLIIFLFKRVVLSRESLVGTDYGPMLTPSIDDNGIMAP